MTQATDDQARAQLLANWDPSVGTDGGDGGIPNPLTAIIIPRTGALSSLQQLTANHGELSSATDQPAIVQTQAMGKPGVTFRPVNTVQSVTLAQLSAGIDVVADVIDVSDYHFGGVTATLTAMFAGQTCALRIARLAGQTSGIDVLTVNGIGTPIYNGYLSAGQAVYVDLYWTGSLWKVIGLRYELPANYSAMIVGIGNNRNDHAASSAAMVGINNVSKGLSTAVMGASNLAIGDYSTVQGYSNRAMGIYATALGYNGIAAQKGVAVGYQNTVSNNGVALGNSNIVGMSPDYGFVTDSNFIVAGDVTTRYPVSSAVMLLGNLNVAPDASVRSMPDSITGVTGTPTYDGVNTTIPVTTTPALDTLQTSSIARILNVNAAANAVAIGANAKASQKGQLAHSNTVKGQYTRTIMGASTTDATPKELNTSSSSSITGTLIGVSNRFILETTKAYAFTCKIFARQVGTANMAVQWLDFLAVNIAGTITVAGAIAPHAAIAANLAVPAATVQADQTNKSIQIMVTGLAATSITWIAEVEAMEIAA